MKYVELCSFKYNFFLLRFHVFIKLKVSILIKNSFILLIIAFLSLFLTFSVCLSLSLFFTLFFLFASMLDLDAGAQMKRTKNSTATN